MLAFCDSFSPNNYWLAVLKKWDTVSLISSPPINTYYKLVYKWRKLSKVGQRRKMQEWLQDVQVQTEYLTSWFYITGATALSRPLPDSSHRPMLNTLPRSTLLTQFGRCSGLRAPQYRRSMSQARNGPQQSLLTAAARFVQQVGGSKDCRNLY